MLKYARSCLAAGAVLFSLLSAEVGAQSAPAGNDLDSGDQGEGAVADGEFKDVGNASAKAISTKRGISVGEATRQLALQHRANAIDKQLKQRFPTTFTGLRFDELGDNFIIFGFTTNPPEGDIRSLAAGLGVRSKLKVTKLSVSEEAGIEEKLLRNFRQTNDVESFSINPDEGVITIHANESVELRGRVRSLLNRDDISVVFDSGARIRVTDAAVGGQAWNAETGPRNGCTTGFSVITSAGTKGILTAGHCEYNSPAEFNIYLNTAYGSAGGSKVTYQNQWISNAMDVQWHTLAETDDVPRPYYWDGGQSIPVTSRATADPAKTSDMCKFGRTTGWGCGKVGDKVTDVAYGGAFNTIIRQDANSLSEGGDSGGPIVSGNVAWGVMHGTTNGNAVFMSVHKLYANGTGLSILGCTTC